jgi:pimeloyl-ACP methyl ester carboxylesterase
VTEADIARALADPAAISATTARVSAVGASWAIRSWGPTDGPPILLIHGVTASSEIWWRVGPALAVALDRPVVAVDQAGHGDTGTWLGHHRFLDNAADVAAVIHALDLDRPDLAVVGHSWGGMTAAELPAVGLAPARLVLLDAPVMSLEEMASRLDDPVEHDCDDLEVAVVALGAAHRDWSPHDVLVKARALQQMDERAVRDILTGNGDWDGGLAALARPEALGADVRIVRSDPRAGGLIPDDAVPALQARVGADRIATITGAAHAPMRLHPLETTNALVRALGPD